MPLLALVTVSLTVLSVSCQSTVDYEICSIKSDSLYEAVRFAMSEFRDSFYDALRLAVWEFRQENEEMKSFIYNSLVVPVNTLPGHQQQKG